MHICVSYISSSTLYSNHFWVDAYHRWSVMIRKWTWSFSLLGKRSKRCIAEQCTLHLRSEQCCIGSKWIEWTGVRSMASVPVHVRREREKWVNPHWLVFTDRMTQVTDAKCKGWLDRERERETDTDRQNGRDTRLMIVLEGLFYRVSVQWERENIEWTRVIRLDRVRWRWSTWV